MVQLNKSSRMNKLSQFLVINIIGIAVTLDYDTRCPNAGEWRFRGKKFSCGRTQYVCLLHSLRNVYHENCEGLDYSSTGSKLIFQPYFDKALCSRNRFQPFPFSTNGNSECVYSKSFCSEKGQYVFHKGNLISDITCGCDLSSGYEFVSKPKHDCYCIPSEEDCSCHKLLCYEKDEQCPHDDDVIKTKRSTDDNMITKLQENDTNKFTYSNKGINLRSLNRAVFTTLLVAMIICGSVYVKIGIYGKPKTPSNLEVIDVSDTSITISWDFVNKSEKKTGFIVNFRIKMGKNSDVWKCMEIENAFENNKFTLRNLQPETLYELKMKSKNTNGSSNYTLLLFQRTRKSDLPEAIYRLREGDRIKYMKLMQSSEIQKRYFLRIMIVGKKSIGKTSLLRRLLKEHIEYVSSTDGVNIVLNRCKINIDNGKWTIESDKDTILQERTDEAISSDSMSLMFSTTTTSNIFSNMYAMCSLWDFSGQKELYAAHQAFLTSSAIYLVVADINDDCFSQDMGSSIVDSHHVGDNVDFWLDTIHCLRTVKNAENEKKKYTIDPFAFLVFTGTDKLKKDDLAKKKLKLENQLKAVGMKSKYQHLQNTIYLSNTCDHEDEFEKLRLEISAAAREMKNWGAKLPIKWIMLEHLIEETKQIGKNFINLSDIMSMARHPDINLLDIEEMLLFLRFQHEVGNLIFFEDIHDLIIINPQWLADAFRCLVSDKYDLRLTPEMEFTQFLKNGKINDILIKELFRSKCRSQFLEQKDCLLKVMEKFDILVRIEDTRFYIIPSMMPDALGEKARRMICFESGEWYRTSWLCLKFTFLPPAFFNHIFVWLIKKYKPSQLGDTSESYELYHGTCIFDMDDQGCKKLIFTMSIDTIALRVVSKQNEFGVMCSILRQEILRKVSVVGKRYNLEICFELNFQCSTGHYYKNTMSYEYLKSVKEYTCKQHKEVHQSKHIYSIWMKNAPEFH